MLNCDIGHSTAGAAAARMQSVTNYLAGFNGGARSAAAARMGSPVSRTGSKCVGGCGAVGAAGATTPAAPATHLGIHSADSGGRPLRVPWRAQAGQLVERGPDPGGGRVVSWELGVGSYRVILSEAKELDYILAVIRSTQHELLAPSS